MSNIRTGEDVAGHILSSYEGGSLAHFEPCASFRDQDDISYLRLIVNKLNRAREELQLVNERQSASLLASRDELYKKVSHLATDPNIPPGLLTETHGVRIQPEPSVRALSTDVPQVVGSNMSAESISSNAGERMAAFNLLHPSSSRSSKEAIDKRILSRKTATYHDEEPEQKISRFHHASGDAVVVHRISSHQDDCRPRMRSPLREPNYNFVPRPNSPIDVKLSAAPTRSGSRPAQPLSTNAGHWMPVANDPSWSQVDTIRIPGVWVEPSMMTELNERDPLRGQSRLTEGHGRSTDLGRYRSITSMVRKSGEGSDSVIKNICLKKPVFSENGHDMIGVSSKRMPDEDVVAQEQRYASNRRSNRLRRLDEGNGLERLRQIIKKQRAGSESDKFNNVGPTAARDATYDISGTSATNEARPVIGCEPVEDYCPAVAHTRHHEEDEVQGRARYYEEEVKTEIPRKIARGPPPPNYRGFSEVDRALVTRISSAPGEPDRSKPAATKPAQHAPSLKSPQRGAKEPLDSGAKVDAEPRKLDEQHDKNRQTATIPPEIHESRRPRLTPDSAGISSTSSKTPVSTGEKKKPSKFDKSDVTTRSWRAGIQAIHEQLGPPSHRPPAPPPPGLPTPAPPITQLSSICSASEPILFSPPSRDTNQINTGPSLLLTECPNIYEHTTHSTGTKAVGSHSQPVANADMHGAEHNLSSKSGDSCDPGLQHFDHAPVADRSCQARTDVSHPSCRWDEEIGSDCEDDAVLANRMDGNGVGVAGDCRESESKKDEHSKEVISGQTAGKQLSMKINSTKVVVKRSKAAALLPPPDKDEHKSGLATHVAARQYNKDEVREYMERQRVERKRAQRAVREERLRTEHHVRHNLEELAKKQRSGSRSECANIASSGRSDIGTSSGISATRSCPVGISKSRSRDNSSGSSTLEAGDSSRSINEAPLLKRPARTAAPRVVVQREAARVAGPASTAKTVQYAERLAALQRAAQSLTSKISRQSESIKQGIKGKQSDSASSSASTLTETHNKVSLYNQASVAMTAGQASSFLSDRSKGLVNTSHAQTVGAPISDHPWTHEFLPNDASPLSKTMPAFGGALAKPTIIPTSLKAFEMTPPYVAKKIPDTRTVEAGNRSQIAKNNYSDSDANCNLMAGETVRIGQRSNSYNNHVATDVGRADSIEYRPSESRNYSLTSVMTSNGSHYIDPPLASNRYLNPPSARPSDITRYKLPDRSTMFYPSSLYTDDKTESLATNSVWEQSVDKVDQQDKHTAVSNGVVDKLSDPGIPISNIIPSVVGLYPVMGREDLLAGGVARSVVDCSVARSDISSSSINTTISSSSKSGPTGRLNMSQPVLTRPEFSRDSVLAVTAAPPVTKLLYVQPQATPSCPSQPVLSATTTVTSRSFSAPVLAVAPNKTPASVPVQKISSFDPSAAQQTPVKSSKYNGDLDITSHSLTAGSVDGDCASGHRSPTSNLTHLSRLLQLSLTASSLRARMLAATGPVDKEMRNSMSSAAMITRPGPMVYERHDESMNDSLNYCSSTAKNEVGSTCNLGPQYRKRSDILDRLGAPLVPQQHTLDCSADDHANNRYPENVAVDSDEELEQSLREVLPSRPERTKLKREATLRKRNSTSSIGSVTDNEVMTPTRHRTIGFQWKSYDEFSADLLRSYLAETQTRVRHQETVLKSKERALLETTRAELTWLEQTSKSVRNKGADDLYPSLVIVGPHAEKQNAEGHRRQQAGLQILQEFAEQALEARRDDEDDTEFLRRSSHLLSERLKESGVRPEDLLDAFNDVLAANDGMSSKAIGGGVSFSDLRGDTDGGDSASFADDSISSARDYSIADQPESPSCEKIARKLKINLDEKFLTVRERILRRRRQAAEELLAWKRRLDEEELEVAKLERQAAAPLLPVKQSTEENTNDRLNTTDGGFTSEPLPVQTMVEQNAVKIDDIGIGSVNKSSILSCDESGEDNFAVPGLTPVRCALAIYDRNGGFEQNKSMTVVSYPALHSGDTGKIDGDREDNELNVKTKALKNNENDKSLHLVALDNKQYVQKKPVANISNDARLDFSTEIDIDTLNRSTNQRNEYSLAQLPSSIAVESNVRRDITSHKSSNQDRGLSQSSVLNFHLVTASAHDEQAPHKEILPVVQNIAEISTEPVLHNSLAKEFSNDSRTDSDHSLSKIQTDSRSSSTPHASEDVCHSTHSVSIHKNNAGKVEENESSKNGRSSSDDYVDDFSEDSRVDAAGLIRQLSSRSSHVEQSQSSRSAKDEELHLSASVNKESLNSAASIKHGETMSSAIQKNTVSVPDDSAKTSHLSDKASLKQQKKIVDEAEYVEIEENIETDDDVSDILSEETRTGVDCRHAVRLLTDTNQANRELKEPFKPVAEQSAMATNRAPSKEKVLLCSEQEEGVCDNTALIPPTTILAESSAAGDVSQKQVDDVLQQSKHRIKYEQFCSSDDEDTLNRQQLPSESDGNKSKSEDIDSQAVDYFSGLPVSARDARFTEDKSEAERRSELERVIISAAEAVEQFENESPHRMELHKEVEQSDKVPTNRFENVMHVTQKYPTVTDNDVSDFMSTADSNRSERTLSSLRDVVAVNAGIQNAELACPPSGKSLSHELIDFPTLDHSVQVSSGSNESSVVDETARQMLLEAVDTILLIKNRKEEKPHCDDEKLSVLSPTVPKKSSALSAEIMPPSNFIKSPPTSPLVSRLDLDPLYNALIGGNDDDEGGWQDDDEIILGPTKSNKPPPYPISDSSGKPGMSAFGAEHFPVISPRLEKKRGAADAPAAFVVPRTSAEVTALVGKVVDAFWESRRYGETWEEGVKPPVDFLERNENVESGTTGGNGGMVATSNKAFKRFVFDLTIEFLFDLYHDERNSVEVGSVSSCSTPLPIATKRPKRIVCGWRLFSADPRDVPTTLDDLKPRVISHVLAAVGLSSPGAKVSPRSTVLASPRGPAGHSKWNSGRKKKDLVDRLLIRELRQEEPDWVNYDDDVVEIKNNLTETLCDMLIADTVRAFRDISWRRKRSLVS